MLWWFTTLMQTARRADTRAGVSEVARFPYMKAPQ